MRTLKLFMLLIFLGTFIFSCEKEDKGIEQMNQESSIQSRSKEKGELDLPGVTKDRYVFRDFEHLTNYYQSLYDLFVEDDEAYNDLIVEIEQINSVHTKLLNDEFSTFEESYQPFLSDIVMQSILNENFEVEVDQVLITYMNNRDLLISDPNDLNTQTEIRQMPKGGELDFDKIPAGAYWGEDTNSESLKPWCGCDISIEQGDCNTIRVFGTCKNLIFGAGGGTVSVFMGTGPFFPQPNGIPFFTTSTNGNFSFEFDMNGSFVVNILATANPDCFFNNTATSTLIFDPNQSTCDPNERNTGYLWAQDSGVQAYSHITSYHKNFWSSYEQARMISKYWNGTKWVKNKSNLRVEIDANRKNKFCSIWETENEVKSCGNCSSKGASVNSGINVQDLVFHCDGDVTGIYKKTLNWNGQTWSIDAVGEVDFECCE